jgi:hypothetical protein
MTPAALDSLFARFLKERKYLQNVRPRTIEWYELVWATFKQSATHSLTEPATLSGRHLQHYVFAMRDRGVQLRYLQFAHSHSTPSYAGCMNEATWRGAFTCVPRALRSPH